MAVSIVTGLNTDILVQFLSEAGFVCASKHQDQLQGLSSLLFNGHPGIFHDGSYHWDMQLITTPSSANVQNEWRYIYNEPCAFTLNTCYFTVTSAWPYRVVSIVSLFCEGQACII
jgi:hypothetical protein